MEKSSRASSSNPTEPPSFFVRTFGVLKARPNVVLAIFVYLSVIPVLFEHIASARDRVKLLRVELHWSLKNLATATRLSVSQISSIEGGANLPRIKSLLAICCGPHKYFRPPASDEL